ncbi:unnamed protein product [Linum tenue]|uniref:Uncharacterized protein n=1 Tax=Linum tenue TaxID=586396 RepID=A0AAV0NKW6_9ROSI|nr:unnamed protein product [Linum tenue]
MSKRKHRPRHPDDLVGYQDGRQHERNNRLRPVQQLDPAALEEELDILGRETRRIISENQAIIDDNIALQSEVTRTSDKIRRLEERIPQLQAEKETDIRELIQTGLKLEAEVRSREPLKSEVRKLRVEVENLRDSVEDYTAIVDSLQEEVTEVKLENEELHSLKAAVDMMHKQLLDARNTLEYEKRAKHDQVQEMQLIENNLTCMHHEIEKLRLEQQQYAGIEEPRYDGGGYQSMDRSSETRRDGRYSDSYEDDPWEFHNHGHPQR